MKLFLSSLGISKQQLEAFTELTNKSPKDTTIALIENAADAETGEKSWVKANRDGIKARGFAVELIDLKDPDLRAKLLDKDVVWLGGGNTFYLGWLLHETGADKIIQDLVRKHGLVYGGGSAGAIMAGPTLRFFEAADDPQVAPEPVKAGLGLTNIVVVPHADNPTFAKRSARIYRQLEAAGFTPRSLADNQALVINDDDIRVVP